MTILDAKRVLSAYRSGNRDAEDPSFREALEQAKRNQKLGKWFILQRVVDDAILANLRGIEPPAGLRLRILARLRECRAQELSSFV